ncbi:YqaJ viral recombinase family protein [Gottfriedia acidiceleris]|uniref:YqaJ viral recombinase family nuclease n=1 Tax=Gottfriedia acidiceleris TaxID=371036 RepID=UPI002FFF37C6
MVKVLVSTVNQNLEDWLSIKNKYVSATDATTILGANKFKTPMQLYLEKTGLIEREKVTSDAAHFGTILEPVVADEFTRRTGIKLRKRNAILQHDTEDWVIGNVDRLVIGENVGFEAKTTSAYNLKEWQDEEIPPGYIIQCQWYMYLTGYESWWIACLVGGQKFIYKKIERDDELIEIVVERCREFWFENVKKNIPPSFDGSEASTNLLGRLYPKAEKESEIELPGEAEELIQKLEEAKEYEKVWSENKKLAENQLKALLGNFETGYANDYVITWKNVNSNRVDSMLLKEQYPEIYQAVCKENASRRFSIK